MTEENPFELSKNKDRTNSPKRPSLVSQKKANIDNGDDFLEIDQNYWSTLKYGMYIKYIVKNEDEFKYGYIVKNGQVNTYKKKDEKIGIKLTNTLYPNAASKFYWFVSYDDISKLYIKIELSTKLMIQNMNNTINTLNINLKKITDYIKKLEERIRIMENVNT